ncbi:MAG: NUDIX domain-containing protein [Propionibacteriaceae bacterium]
MPHTNPEHGGHCPTVSGWIIRKELGTEPRVLVHMHKKYHSLLQPGGHIEHNEFAWKALLRELREETGYCSEQLAVLQPYELKPKKLTGNLLTPTPLLQNCHLVDQVQQIHHWDTVFALVTDQEPSAEIMAQESGDIRWMTVEELAKSDQVWPDVVTIAQVALSVLETWIPVPAIEFPVTL